MVAGLYLKNRDWQLTRDLVRSDNRLQVRTAAASLRISKEVVARLEHLDAPELECVVEGNVRERGYLLWAAACRRYEFIREFAVEVLREYFLTLRQVLSLKDFLKDFYTDHVKRYKERPIYWLFSSPKGSFNALIYLHRYRPDTVSVVLQYLRDFRSKLVSERDHQEQMSIGSSASQGEKTKALKRIEELKKVLVELDDYERETLYPLATHQVSLDLDDGVKVNYVKLGAALKKIPGLDAKDDE